MIIRAGYFLLLPLFLSGCATQQSSQIEAAVTPQPPVKVAIAPSPTPITIQSNEAAPRALNNMVVSPDDSSTLTVVDRKNGNFLKILNRGRLSKSEEVYFEHIRLTMNTLQQDWISLGPDNVWSESAEKTINVIYRAHRKVAKVPTRFRKAHNAIGDGLQEVREAYQSKRRADQTGSSEDLLQAANLIESGTDKFSKGLIDLANYL